MVHHKARHAAAAVIIVSMVTFDLAQLGAASDDRMPPIPQDKLTEAQKAAIDAFRVARKAEPSGPFLTMLRSPEVMTRARAMGDYLRYNSALPPRLSEFVILLTARHWSQQYEWFTHYPP